MDVWVCMTLLVFLGLQWQTLGSVHLGVPSLRHAPWALKSLMDTEKDT